ncbi:MAG: TniQ family protein [Thaumarchaeota archaeon]|nr:TniQ family protein [Nitrososphaerota archaeon]
MRTSVTTVTLPRFPIHPRPLPDESMESWVLRRAYANFFTILQLARRHHGLSLKGCNYDFLDSENALFRMATSGIEEAQSAGLVFSSFKTALGSNWKLWATPSLGPRRFCPLCFAEEEVPHLKLIWRLNFVVVCLKHYVFLQSQCGRCGAAFRPTNTNRSFDIRTCHRCANHLDGRVVPAGQNDSGCVGIKALVQVLEGTTNPKSFGWSGSIQELFSTVEFLTRFIGKLNGQEGRLAHARGIAVLQRSANFNLNLIGTAWTLLCDTPMLEEFIQAHQRQFNRSTRGSCPEFLKRFRWLHGQAAKKVDFAPAFKAAAIIANRGERVDLKKVAEESGLNHGTLQKRNAGLRILARNLQREFKEHRRRNLIEAMGGAPVSQVITNRWLAKSTGLPKSVVQDMCYGDPFLRGLRQSSKSKTKHYFASFSCRNPKCHEYGLALTGRVRDKRIRGPTSLEPSREAILRCATCNNYFCIDVSKAPLQRAYGLDLGPKIALVGITGDIK